MKPYYEDDSVTLYHGDCREVLRSMADESVDCVITDPPYTERTHKNARSSVADGSMQRSLSGSRETFGAIDDEALRRILADAGRVTRGWVVATLDYRHAVGFEERYCEIAAKRLAQDTLFGGVA